MANLTGQIAPGRSLASRAAPLCCYSRNHGKGIRQWPPAPARRRRGHCRGPPRRRPAPRRWSRRTGPPPWPSSPPTPRLLSSSCAGPRTAASPPSPASSSTRCSPGKSPRRQTLTLAPDESVGDASGSLTLGVVALRRHGKVAYLDTDVGQPEFGLPGCLSFHIVDEDLEGWYIYACADFWPKAGFMGQWHGGGWLLCRFAEPNSTGSWKVSIFCSHLSRGIKL